MGTPPPALCARRSYTPIHCVRHWTVDPQPPCHLAGRGRRPLIGPSSADEPVWAVQTIPVRTADRSLSCGCATTLAWITTWSAGKHCAMAPPTRILLHVAHIHAVRAHSSGANGFPRGPPISFSESTALFTHGCSVSLPVHFSRGESCHGAHMLGLIPVLPTPRAGWFTACSPTAVWLSSAAPLPRGPFGFRALHPTTRPHTGTHVCGGPQITVV